MRRAVFLTRRAQQQSERALRWWSRNRDKAPFAFDEEMAETLDLISTNAGVGVPFRARRRWIRRVLMERVRYYLYYRISDDDQHIEVLAVWHASRRPPRL